MTLTDKFGSRRHIKRGTPRIKAFSDDGRGAIQFFAPSHC